MPIFIRLANLTEQGISKVGDLPRILSATASITSDLGAKTLHTYVTLGRYDVVSIIDAPDLQSAAAIGARIATEGDLKSETLAAVDVEELISAMKQ